MVSNLYSSPEVVKGRAFDSRGDLWAMGIILYEMLYGSPPFTEEEVAQFSDKFRVERKIIFPQKNCNVTDYTKNMIEKLLVFKQQERMTPEEFLNYPLKKSNPVPTIVAKKATQNFESVAIFIRKCLLYLV